MSDYNGWKNYETWCVNLWISNDPGSEEAARECVEVGDTYGTGEQIESMVTEWVHADDLTGLASDLLNGALCEVDWREIADAYIEAVQEQWENEGKCRECGEWLDADCGCEVAV